MVHPTSPSSSSLSVPSAAFEEDATAIAPPRAARPALDPSDAPKWPIRPTRGVRTSTGTRTFAQGRGAEGSPYVENFYTS